eukprot:CAMPEP_0198293020 /NCGR_PEP_ID=MMETSP1449-20131203/14972_1 /TAXON_ID=420275 /ORGANISM="Attheya septentrionalis, Strain CCMP2084" /LENGTH=237 /DNA_ID=CAMNT_0043992419 /DNA_START=305 /DNA_END=1015 /DNA_ORIENTATION=+
MTQDDSHDARTTVASNDAKPVVRRRPIKGKSSIIKEHYRVDKNVLLPGVLKHDDSWARDIHDFFNLIFLVPLVVLNVLNWNWEILFDQKKESFSEAWTGEWYDLFFQMTVYYFVADLIWVMVVPNCVKSPTTIVQHHVVTLIYLLVPYLEPEFQWVMGACMTVEANTWFLIARRVFNKQAFPPWVIDLPPFISIRVKLISICFYSTWILIRCIFYPYLMVCIWHLWLDLSERTGSRW